MRTSLVAGIVVMNLVTPRVRSIVTLSLNLTMSASMRSSRPGGVRVLAVAPDNVTVTGPTTRSHLAPPARRR
jgi:hypothetical protein